MNNKRGTNGPDKMMDNRYSKKFSVRHAPRLDILHFEGAAKTKEGSSNKPATQSIAFLIDKSTAPPAERPRSKPSR